MYRSFYGLDWTYMVLILPCLILSLWASSNVNSTFRRYSRQYSVHGLTGAQAAARVLAANGVQGVRIEHISGNLNDHFDPATNVIRLSDSVYSNTSTAAIGVACHEAGHACQYAQDYLPIRIRAAIIPATNIGSKAAIPLILIGMLLSGLGDFSAFLVDLGILFFSLSVIFQLVTLPVEFDASRRAMTAIDQSGLLTETEQAGARKTLRAAAMTYVAATATAIAQLLRLILLFGNRGGNNRRR